jgi:hypothetical protein
VLTENFSEPPGQKRKMRGITRLKDQMDDKGDSMKGELKTGFGEICMTGLTHAGFTLAAVANPNTITSILGDT